MDDITVELQRQINAIQRELDRFRAVETTPLNVAWIAPTLGSGWANYGGGYRTARYRKIGDIVFIEGLVLRSSGTNQTIFSLPSGFYPSQRSLYTCECYTGVARVDITETGAVYYVSGGSVSGYLSLNGIQLSTL